MIDTSGWSLNDWFGVCTLSLWLIILLLVALLNRE